MKVLLQPVAQVSSSAGLFFLYLICSYLICSLILNRKYWPSSRIKIRDRTNWCMHPNARTHWQIITVSVCPPIATSTQTVWVSKRQREFCSVSCDNNGTLQEKTIRRFSKALLMASHMSGRYFPLLLPICCTINLFDCFSSNPCRCDPLRRYSLDCWNYYYWEIKNDTQT